MNKELFLLGLIFYNELYGYHINELIDTHFEVVVNISKPTAYRLLGKMADSGWITSHEEVVGNRPPRKIFSITEKGKTIFLKLLEDSIKNYDPQKQLSNVVSLAFLQTIPSEKLIELLKLRKNRVLFIMDMIRDSEKHQQSFYYMFDNQINHLNAEINWIDNTINSLK